MRIEADLPNRRPPSRAGRAAIVVGSLLVSLGMAELGARVLHHGAFPYLNIYVADDRYGVRLAPSTATRVRSRLGRVTEIETNALGFRGAADTSPDAHSARLRVLLLGDSQVLGYGLPHAETIGARLERLLGKDAVVVSAAVPAWGPAEYVLALGELQPRLQPQYVVFVANAANDWFELSMPAARRVTAFDGWAARSSPKRQAHWQFPGRSFLLGRSHLALAVRQLAGYVGGAEAPAAESALLLLRDLAQLRRPADGHRSRMTSSLLQARDLCAQATCTVVAAALPVDVQVDPREWAKYRARPVDLAPTEALLTDFVEDAREAGLAAVDLTPALRRVEPGAFLPDDYHLSARGAHAVAEVLAAALREEGAVAQVHR